MCLEYCILTILNSIIHHEIHTGGMPGGECSNLFYMCSFYLVIYFTCDIFTCSCPLLLNLTMIPPFCMDLLLMLFVISLTVTYN